MAVLTHCLFVQVVAHLLRPAASYRAVELGASVVQVSVIGAAYAVLPIVLGPLIGTWIDRRGTRIVAFAGALLVLASSLLLATIADEVWLLAVATGILGLGHLCCVAAQQVVVSHARPDLLDVRLGYYTFVASIAQTVAPLLLAAFGAGDLLPRTNGMFWMAVGLSGVLLIATAGLDGPRRERAGSTAAQGGPGPSARSLAPAMISGAVVLSTVDLLTIYLPVLGARQGLDAGWVGVLLAARAGASMVSRLSFGRIVHRVGRASLLTWSMASTTACMLLLTVSTSLPVIFVLVLVIGWCLGVGQPVTMAWVISLTPERIRGRILALRLVANRVSQVVVPTLAGVASVGAGVRGVMAVGAAATGMTAMMAHRERRRPDQAP